MRSWTNYDGRSLRLRVSRFFASEVEQDCWERNPFDRLRRPLPPVRTVFRRGFVRRFYLRWLRGLSPPPATKERKQGEVLQVRALRASGAEGVVGPTDIHLTSCRDDPATPSRRMRSILQRNEVPHHSVSLRETALPFRESRCHPGIVNACESQNREMRHRKNGGRPH